MEENAVKRAVNSATEPVREASARVQEAVRPVTDSAKQVGSNVGRAVNRGWLFLDGTIKGALDFTAKFGRQGLKIGAIAGVIGMLAPAGITVVGLGLLTGLEIPLFGALGGALAGSALGVGTGLLRGGYDRLQLENRKEKYAAQLDEKRRSQRVPTRRRDGPNTAFARASEQIDRVDNDLSINHLERLDAEAQMRSGGNDRYFRDQEEAREADLVQGLNR